MKKQKNIIHFITSILKPESITTIYQEKVFPLPSVCSYLIFTFYLFFLRDGLFSVEYCL